MKIAPMKFLDAVMGVGQEAALGVLRRALIDTAGEQAHNSDTEVDWHAVSARALAILEEGDADADAYRQEVAAGKVALADLFPPASRLDRAELNQVVVYGIKRLGQIQGASLL